jgi:hypothetical protein
VPAVYAPGAASGTSLFPRTIHKTSTAA